ncbi:MAG: hypothetical protein BWX54_02059 [Verrucomicrobia bacterium ADurb.Bin018]|nr:MAG: hypothetical protein BWX54_02059 [Verrucomicrobia bacterium ADurb.Bin018]
MATENMTPAQFGAYLDAKQRGPLDESSNATPAQFGAYLDAKQGAAYIRVSTRHYARLVARGLIPKKRLSPGCVRYRKSDLDALMAK